MSDNVKPCSPSATGQHLTGWPTTTGPTAALHRLGMWPHLGTRPAWLQTAKTHTDTKHRTSYTGTAGFLSDTAIRSFAALTFEGWHVRINSAGRLIEFRISPTDNITTRQDNR